MLSWIGDADAIDTMDISAPKRLRHIGLQRTDFEEVEKWHEGQEADDLVDGSWRHVEYEHKDTLSDMWFSWVRAQVRELGVRDWRTPVPLETTEDRRKWTRARMNKIQSRIISIYT